MRFFPILTALAVIAVLYLLVFERDRLLAVARNEPVAEAAVTEDTETAARPAAVATRAVAVVAFRSAAQVVESAVLLRGQSEAARQVDVRSETTGLVISEPLRKGTEVEKGQLLCSIDPGTRQIGLSEAQARLAEARARVPEVEAGIPAAQARVAEAEGRLIEANARLQEAMINARAAVRLNEGGFASQTRVASTKAALEAARAGVKAAESGVKSATSGIAAAGSAIEGARAGVQSAEGGVASAQNEIERLDISAPFEGLLESDTAEIGSLLQAGALCATIIQLDPIKLVGFAPETEVDRITLGARATARLASGREVFGRVTFISRAADPATRTFRTEIIVANADLAIRDGQTAEILIESAGAAAHLLPQSALTLNGEGELGVRLVGAGDVAQFQLVELLRDTVAGVWLAGLPQVVEVIVVGQEFVTDNTPLDVTYAEASQ